MTTFVKWFLCLLGAGLLLTVIALVLETNPPVTAEPTWDSPQTRILAQRACCHSNETSWPWYDRMLVGSWIAAFDTLRGRRALNFSEWRAGGRTRDVAETIQRGSMPPAIYTMMHPTAILTDQEKQQLIQGLQNSLK